MSKFATNNNILDAEKYINIDRIDFSSIKIQPLHFVIPSTYISKPEISSFVINRFSNVDEKVLDPFLNFGTNSLEALLQKRIPYGSDVNQLSLKISMFKTKFF